MYTNILYFAIKSFYVRRSFFMFHYVLFNERPSFVCVTFIFYSKIDLWLINYLAKMFAVKWLAAKILMAEMPDMPKKNPQKSLL